MVLCGIVLAGCQSTTPPPAADDAKPMTYGDWTVRTGGYVRADAAMVR